MSIQNCKVSFLRPSFANLREWMDDPNHEYIGRRGIVFINKERFPKSDSIWANPYKITTTQDRTSVLIKYETDIRKKLEENPELKKKLLELKGKKLGCWCSPEPCHGHVLLKLIEEYKE